MSFFIQWIYLLALALWIGAIIFFSFFTTPILFTQLPKEIAGEAVSALFPRYYALGYAAGGAMLLMTLLEALLLRHVPWIRLIILLLMLSASVYAGVVVRPQVHQLKVQMKAAEEGTELGASLKAKFDQKHRLSVILNMIVLLGGILLIAIVAFRLRL